MLDSLKCDWQPRSTVLVCNPWQHTMCDTQGTQLVINGLHCTVSMRTSENRDTLNSVSSPFYTVLHLYYHFLFRFVPCKFSFSLPTPSPLLPPTCSQLLVCCPWRATWRESAVNYSPSKMYLHVVQCQYTLLRQIMYIHSPAPLAQPHNKSPRVSQSERRSCASSLVVSSS